jgi:hypothetical protein
VLRIARELPRWRWTWVFDFIPRVMRDANYDVVAGNRYHWFGRRDACIVPNSEWSPALSPNVDLARRATEARLDGGPAGSDRQSPSSRH